MKILALDLDGTAIGAHHFCLPYYLSPDIVEYAIKHKFDCVIFVTKRSISSLAQDIWQYVIKCPESLRQTNDTVNIRYKDNNFNIHRPYFLSCLLGNAAQNFHVATDIPLLTISTEDDVFLEDCGSGYMSLVMPREKKIMKEGRKYYFGVTP